MESAKCPKCDTIFSVDIKKALDQHGEVFKCPNCGFEILHI